MFIFLGTVGIILLVLAFYFRNVKIVVTIVSNVIIKVEKELNTATGQVKLESAVAQIESQLPSYLSIFITKSNLVSLIEFMLNIISKGFGIDYEADIIGNDDDITFNLTNSKETNLKGFDIRYDSNVRARDRESDFNIYGKLKMETDFKGNDRAGVEIGFKKNF